MSVQVCSYFGDESYSFIFWHRLLSIYQNHCLQGSVKVYSQIACTSLNDSHDLRTCRSLKKVPSVFAYVTIRAQIHFCHHAEQVDKKKSFISAAIGLFCCLYNVVYYYWL